MKLFPPQARRYRLARDEGHQESPGPIGDRTTCPGDVEGGCWGGASRRRWSRLDRENRCGGQWRIDTVVDNGQGRAQPDGDGQRGSRADEVAAHRAFVPDS